MKQYFVKYLPVEGEIKKGDKYIHSNYPNEIFCLYNDSNEAFELNKAKKVKLFLCTKEIQIGDKFDQLPGINGKTYTCMDIKDGSYIDDEGKSRVIATCFKVIGEISPDATWVKENDEFNKDEIKTVIYNFIAYYGVKGSCGHYH